HTGYAFLPPMIHDAFRFLPHDRRESDIQSVSPGRYISMQSQNPYAINNDWINLSYEILFSLLQRCRLETLDLFYYESSYYASNIHVILMLFQFLTNLPVP